jgi:hypothetical protein
MEETFYTLEPEQFPTITLGSYAPDTLREMAYFLWSMYPDNVDVMMWRQEKLLPLLSPRTDMTESEDE